MNEHDAPAWLQQLADKVHEHFIVVDDDGVILSRPVEFRFLFEFCKTLGCWHAIVFPFEEFDDADVEVDVTGIIELFDEMPDIRWSHGAITFDGTYAQNVVQFDVADSPLPGYADTDDVSDLEVPAPS